MVSTESSFVFSATQHLVHMYSFSQEFGEWFVFNVAISSQFLVDSSLTLPLPKGFEQTLGDIFVLQNIC